jgi:hypothetical protein
MKPNTVPITACGLAATLAGLSFIVQPGDARALPAANGDLIQIVPIESPYLKLRAKFVTPPGSIQNGASSADLRFAVMNRSKKRLYILRDKPGDAYYDVEISYTPDTPYSSMTHWTPVKKLAPTIDHFGIGGNANGLGAPPTTLAPGEIFTETYHLLSDFNLSKIGYYKIYVMIKLSGSLINPADKAHFNAHRDKIALTTSTQPLVIQKTETGFKAIVPESHQPPKMIPIMPRKITPSSESKPKVRLIQEGSAK